MTPILNPNQTEEIFLMRHNAHVISISLEARSAEHMIFTVTSAKLNGLPPKLRAPWVKFLVNVVGIYSS